MNIGVQVTVAENECDSGIQLTTESDGSLKIESVTSKFPECFTLAFKCLDKWKAVEKKNEKFIPPQGGWGTTKYVCFTGRKVKFQLTNLDVKFTEKVLEKYLNSYGIVEVQKFDKNKSIASVIIRFLRDDCLEEIKRQQHSFSINEVVQIDREIFSKRSGTTNMGHEFEKLTMASLLINLTTDGNVEDFRMSSNDEDFGSFDDIVLDINLTNGDEHKYALQLKYKNDSKKSLKKYLTSVGDFSILKYFKDFTEMIEYTKKYNLILFTNLKFNAQEGELLILENTNVELKIVKEELPEEFGKGFCYKFVPTNTEISDQHKMFFNKFLLFPDRPNIRKMEEDLFRKFNTEFFCKYIENYLKFIAEWTNKIRNKRLNKMFIKELITLQMLATTFKSFPFVKKEDTKEALYIKEATLNFTATVVDKKYFENIKKIWENETISESEIERVIGNFQLRNLSNDEKRVTALWIMNRCPLIITESETAYKVISLLCREKHFVLLKKENTLVPIENVKVFTKLADLDSNSTVYKNITKTFHCSIQRKQAIKIEDLIEQCKDFQNVVTTNELIQMLDGPLTVGEQETVLNIYIDRLLTRLTIAYTFFDNIDKDTLIIISCQGRECILKDRLKSFNLINIDDYLNQYERGQTENVRRIQGKTAYFSKNQCTRETFDIILKRNPNKKNCHHFRIVEDEVLEWVYSQGEISDLQKYKTNSSFLKETDLLNTERTINIITADPGMGKTELMKKFNNVYSSSFWTILIRARDWSEYFKREDCSIEHFLHVAIENTCKTKFEEDMLTVLRNTRRITFLWDGLDELTSTLIDMVINLIDHLAKEGFKQWISCRKRLEDKLEKKFNVLSRSIKQFDENEQRRYISERLGNQDFNLKEVVFKINSYIDRVQYNEILGIPLQIFMLTELLLKHPNMHTLLNEVFPITDLYKQFVSMKFKIFFKEKNNFEEGNSVLQLMMKNFQNEQLKYHQKAALAFIEDDLLENIEDIALNSPISDEETIYGIGIITGKTVDGKSIFLHYSYAEYFVALYLYENRSKFDVLIKEHIFQENYQNVRFMFDLLLAKKSPPHLAVLYNNFDYLKSCQDYTCKDEGGRNPLQIACAWGPRFPLLKIVHQGAELIIDDERASFVDLSRRQHYDEMINLLLEHNNVLDKDLFFHLDAIEYADLSHSLKPLEIFSKEKYDLTFNRMKNFNNILTVLYYSVKFNYNSILYSFQNIPFLKTINNSNTILHVASESNSIDCLKILLRDENHRLKIDTVDQYGKTPIYVAAALGHYEIVEYLAKTGADINIQDEDGWLPIHIATQNGRIEVVKLLVGDLKTNVDAKTEEGYTPLYIAAAAGHCLVIEYLAESGADVNIQAQNGWNPIHMAAHNGHIDVVKLFVGGDFKINVNTKTEEGFTPLFTAAATGHCEVVKFLVESGADINIQDQNDWTPIHIAANNGYVDVVEYLGRAGADVNIRDADGWAPLHMAVEIGSIEVVKLLVNDLKADVNAEGDEGYTPLFIATGLGYCEMVKCLAESGANVNIQYQEGWSPIHVAARNGHIEIVKLLVNLKADVNARNNEGFTPSDLAAKYDHHDVVEYLKNQNVNTALFKK